MSRLGRSSRVSSTNNSCHNPRLFLNQNDIEIRNLQIRERWRFLCGRIKSSAREYITLKNLVNAAFIISICIVCLQQCYNQVSEYLEYKTRIQVSHGFARSTVFLLPGVTICNNNRLRLDRLADEVPSIKSDVAKILNDTKTGALTDRRRIELIKSIRQAVDESVNISKIINESPISKLLRLSSSSMIKDVNCNTSWGKQINCENIRVIESFQGVPCYTAFYLGSLLEALANGKAYDYQTSLLNGSRKLTHFDSHEIAEIRIDFEPLQHGDFNRDVGGKIIIHSTGHVGSVRDVAHAILPGMKYEMVIQRLMSKRLPPPYESMCYNYKQNNAPLFTSGERPTGYVELDKTSCTRNCIVRQVTRECNCWPVEVPHYPDEDIVENSGSYRLCEWGHEEVGKLGNSSAKLYVDCYRKFHADCRASCNQGCRTEDYRVLKMSNSWPGREKFLLAATAEEKAELSRLRGCCAVISIKYLDFIERRHTMIPHLTLAQLVSNIGGIVSALIGVSTVTIYRYITRRILHCRIINDDDLSQFAASRLSLTRSQPS